MEMIVQLENRNNSPIRKWKLRNGGTKNRL